LGSITWSNLWTEGAGIAEWSHSGMAVLSDGRIVFAESGGHALIVLDEAVRSAVRIPTPTEDGHGITATPGGSGDLVIVADPGSAGRPGQVLEVSIMTGESTALPVPTGASTATEPWKPTSTAVVEAGGSHDGELWIADGYGRSLVHRVLLDGSTETFDGSSTGLRFDCPHGVAIDNRGDDALVVVADRSNRRLVFLDLDGEYVRSVEDSLLTSPSSIAVRGSDLLITDLYGALLRVDANDVVSAVLPIDNPAQPEGWPNRIENGVLVRPPLRDGTLNSPHGIAVGASGDVYLTEWLIGGRQIRLSFTRE
jgi:hypothetical protein